MKKVLIASLFVSMISASAVLACSGNSCQPSGGQNYFQDRQIDLFAGAFAAGDFNAAATIKPGTQGYTASAGTTDSLTKTWAEFKGAESTCPGGCDGLRGEIYGLAIHNARSMSEALSHGTNAAAAAGTSAANSVVGAYGHMSGM
jgi:hypothetical protein